MIVEKDSNMDELINTPAYIRRKVALNTPVDDYAAPASALTPTQTGGHQLSSDNPYLHQRLD
jgi:hypothetical protein